MDNGSLEARLESLEKQVSTLTEKLIKKEIEIEELKDIEDIKKLQVAYAYYLENSMGQSVIDCFSNDPGISGTFVEGTYKGPEGIKRYFGRMMEKNWGRKSFYFHSNRSLRSFLAVPQSTIFSSPKSPPFLYAHIFLFHDYAMATPWIFIQ